MNLIQTTSKKIRAFDYDVETNLLVLDFARGEQPAKLYRYLEVPESIYAELLRRHATHNSPDASEHESVGEYIKEVTGGFRDPEIPFAFEKIDEHGNVLERSSKPIRVEPVPLITEEVYF